MTTTYSTSIDALGCVSVRAETDGLIHRQVLAPGRYSDTGEWRATDISGEPEEVVTACNEAWTPEIVAAYQTAFPAPEPVSPYRDLNRIQFEFMVEKLGCGSAIEAAIEAMPATTEAEQNERIMARVLYRSGQRFERGHPLFSELAPSVGYTSDQIDQAWLTALSV